MKIPAVILLSLLVFGTAASAQPVPQDQMPRLPAIDAKALAQKFDKDGFVESLKARFARVRSFAFAYHVSDPQKPDYYAECWKEIGEQHYYEYDEPSEKLHDIFFYNGKQTLLRRVSGNIVYARKGEPDVCEPPASWQSPQELYAFVDRDANFPSMKSLGPDSPVWKDLASRMDYAGTTTFLDRDCIVLRFRGAFDQRKREKATYDVFFDTATMTPLGWQAYDDQAYMIDELALAELKPFAGGDNAGPFVYMPHYTHTSYQWPGEIRERPSGKLILYNKGTRDEVFDEVEVDTLKPQDLQFDLTGVKVIIDMDTQKETWLPK